uniref:Uncharacterized protein n=1 Tax=Moniliophthora roreri TaxID=221103 RepID=A0A0W0EZI8_MONRR
MLTPERTSLLKEEFPTKGGHTTLTQAPHFNASGSLLNAVHRDMVNVVNDYRRVTNINIYTPIPTRSPPTTQRIGQSAPISRPQYVRHRGKGALKATVVPSRVILAASTLISLWYQRVRGWLYAFLIPTTGCDNGSFHDHRVRSLGRTGNAQLEANWNAGIAHSSK